MKKLNYTKLMASNPYVIQRSRNAQGQKMEFVEHPTEGDDYPVIVVFHDAKLAFNTGFFDTGDFHRSSDYMPVLVGTECKCQFEV